MKHRRVRSLLTITGIIIGIGAIIALISVSQGLENAIEEQFELFGKDRVFIAPQGFSGPGSPSKGFTIKDVEAVESTGEFQYVNYFISRNSEIERKNEVKFAFVAGLHTDDIEAAFGDIDIKLRDGRFMRSGEKFVAMLGFRAADELFSEEIRVRNKIKIFGQDFKVVGIFEEIGNPEDDNQITIPMEAARIVFNEPEAVEGILGQIKPGGEIKNVQAKVEKALERSRDDENFQVLTAAQIAEQINQVLGIVQVVLVGIAAISLVVGGIGIMNSMYTSVVERTKEIGIMKAIGAQNKDVLIIFLIESGFLGLVGGFFGVVLGLGIAKIVELAAASAGFSILKIELGFGLILFGIFFSFIIGMVSGVVPAWQASKLKPVDALRYE